MPTKSGKTFSIRETLAPWTLALRTLDTILTRMDQLDQRLQEYREQDDTNCRELATRLDRIEIN